MAYDIQAVQRGEITEHPRRMLDIGNVLSPIIRTSAEELMECLENFTKDSIEAAKKEIAKEAFEGGVREGLRRQQILDAATTVDGVIYVSDLE